MATEQEKRWVDAWRIAGPELERLRNLELQNLDEFNGTRQATLLGVPIELIKPRKSEIGKLAALFIKSQALQKPKASTPPNR